MLRQLAADTKLANQMGNQGSAVVELAHERDFRPTRPIRESLKLSRACVKRDLGY